MQDEDRDTAADIAFRRRALMVNSSIYARRHGPRLSLLLTGPIQARYVGQLAWVGSERTWRAVDADRVRELAAEIERIGQLRPEVAETCAWHATRLSELARQHAVLARLEEEQRPRSACPAAREQADIRCKQRNSSRRLSA